MNGEQTTGTGVAELIEQYRGAYEARDIDAIMALFAPDAVYTAAPGTFRGRPAIRSFFEWDARLSPTAQVRDTGVGVLIAGDRVVWERVIALTYENRPYEEDAVAVIEFGADGLIRQQRSYYDKLAVLDRIASQVPGVSGWLQKKLVRYLVTAGSKGLTTVPE